MKKLGFLLLSILASFTLHAQEDDLMSMLDEVVEDEPLEVAYTFKSTHVINAHSIERMKSKQLDFRINHRFGEVGLGAYELWGIDQALVSFDFGYGVTDWLMVGIRRSTYKKIYDGSLKFSILRQTEGSKNIPVAVSYYNNMAINTLKNDITDYPTTHRLSYTHQILVARKFNQVLSLQLMPTFVHRNEVNFNEDNDIYALGIGGRVKFHRRIAFMFEYFYTSHNNFIAKENDLFRNPLSIGFDIETGGHVFQLFASNSRIMEESGFISQTTGTWKSGNYFLGFNISRVFAIGKAKK